VRSRPNLPAGAKDVDRRLAASRQAAPHAGQHEAHVVGRNIALAVGAGSQPFEHLGGLCHRRFGPFDVDLPSYTVMLTPSALRMRRKC